MEYCIALESARPSFEEAFYVTSSSLDADTLFLLDKSLRAAANAHPLGEWAQVSGHLAKNGFIQIKEPSGPVFYHSRAWDEHFIGGEGSFFVTFPTDAPWEVAGQMLLATSSPMLYALVSSDYTGEGKVVLINVEHEAVHHDDMAWSDEECTEKLPIGPLILNGEQFFDNTQFQRAKDALIRSGYKVLA
jgi:hypothetical protein